MTQNNVKTQFIYNLKYIDLINLTTSNDITHLLQIAWQKHGEIIIKIMIS